MDNAGIEYLKEKNFKSVFIFSHPNADPDAICSAFTFSKLLTHLKPEVNVKIAFPKGISRLGKRLVSYFKLEIFKKKPKFGNKVIFLIDAGNTRQLGNWDEQIRSASSQLFVIDHHFKNPEKEEFAQYVISDETSSSTCEIIYELFKKCGLKPSIKEAEAFFLGIAFDTKHFSIASSRTFKTIAELVDLGVNSQIILPLLSLPVSNSERVAHLKSCKRLKILLIKNWIIVFSKIGSFQASTARALIVLGAHLAFVGKEEKNTLQISLRSSQDFYVKTNFHLGKDLAIPIGDFLNGTGGGHSTAAGISAIGKFETAVKKFKKIIKEKI
jgi:nanoRNase/pAp phosphatase (c-di-AMP/oligoRNAs hydrolase)